MYYFDYTWSSNCIIWKTDGAPPIKVEKGWLRCIWWPISIIYALWYTECRYPSPRIRSISVVSNWRPPSDSVRPADTFSLSAGLATLRFFTLDESGLPPLENIYGGVWGPRPPPSRRGGRPVEGPLWPRPLVFSQSGKWRHLSTKNRVLAICLNGLRSKNYGNLISIK